MSETIADVPVHIGAVELKKILYDQILPLWKRRTNNFPLPIDHIIMRSEKWVVLAPRNPDIDIIADQFFKIGKKGSRVFKTGTCVILFHIPNDDFDIYLKRVEKDEEEEYIKNAVRTVNKILL